MNDGYYYGFEIHHLLGWFVIYLELLLSINVIFIMSYGIVTTEVLTMVFC